MAWHAVRIFHSLEVRHTSAAKGLHTQGLCPHMTGNEKVEHQRSRTCPEVSEDRPNFCNGHHRKQHVGRGSLTCMNDLHCGVASLSFTKSSGRAPLGTSRSVSQMLAFETTDLRANIRQKSKNKRQGPRRAKTRPNIFRARDRAFTRGNDVHVRWRIKLCRTAEFGRPLDLASAATKGAYANLGPQQ